MEDDVDAMKNCVVKSKELTDKFWKEFFILKNSMPDIQEMESLAISILGTSITMIFLRYLHMFPKEYRVGLQKLFIDGLAMIEKDMDKE